MILLAISRTEIFFLVMVAIVLVFLLTVILIRYSKAKIEDELDTLSVEQIVLDKQKNELKEKDTIKEAFVDNNIKKEPVSVPNEAPLSEIEILLEQMQTDLTKEDNSPVHTFEEEQEEKSIISYQELKAMKESKNECPEIDMSYDDEALELPTTVSVTKELSNNDEVVSATYLKPFKTTAFSNSDFISPVYGKVDTGTITYPSIPNFKEEFNIEHNDNELIFDDVKVNLNKHGNMDLENTFDLKPLSEETKKNDEFLQALKDFRNNLE